MLVHYAVIKGSVSRSMYALQRNVASPPPLNDAELSQAAICSCKRVGTMSVMCQNNFISFARGNNKRKCIPL